MAKGMTGLDWAAVILVLAGAVNWLGVAFGYNLVQMLVGSMAKYVYMLVGVSGLYGIARLTFWK